MIFSLLGLWICLYSYKHFHRGFILFLIYRMFLALNVVVVAIKDMPSLRVDMVMTFYFLVLFYLNRKKYTTSAPFPFTTPFIFLVISWTISSIFSYAGILATLPQYIGNISKDIFLVYVIWKVIEVKDLKLLLKGFSIVFVIACIYGLFEKITLLNPLRDYEESLAGDNAVMWAYSEDDVRGYRIQSVFEHAIGAGVNFVLYIILVLMLYLRYKLEKYISVNYLLLCAACGVCAIWTNSRTPVLFLAIASISFVNFQDARTYKFLILISIVGFLMAPLFVDYFDIFETIVNQDSQKTMYGSNSDLRWDQLASSLALFSMSPIWGLGFSYDSVLKGTLVESLLGRESIWFNILPELGIIGAISYIIYIWYSLVLVPLQYKNIVSFSLFLAYWIVASLTSIPGMKMHFFYIIVFLSIKMSSSYVEKYNRS